MTPDHEHRFVATIGPDHPAAREWSDGFGGFSVAIVSPIAQLVSVPGSEATRAYLVDVEALDDEARARLAVVLGRRFGIPVRQVLDGLATDGVPILSAGVTVTRTCCEDPPADVQDEPAPVDPDAEMGARLAGEFMLLGADDSAASVATFSVRPFEAYTLIGTLQAASRHPALSDAQRTIVLGFADQVAGPLVEAARAVLGADSAIEATIGMGFDPAHDWPTDDADGSGQRCRACGCTDEDGCPEGCWWVEEDLCSSCARSGGAPADLDGDDEPAAGGGFWAPGEDSPIVGEGQCRYVEPACFVVNEHESEMELLQCALCTRFFLQMVPIRLFQDLGDRVVLGFAVCEGCAPRVMARMQGGGR